MATKRSGARSRPVDGDASAESRPLVGSVPPAEPRERSSRYRPEVGAQVRRLRQERGLTLSRIAQRSGLNVGYLSQIENDKSSPSLETLASLADAIGVPIAWFLVDASRPPRVVRAGERRAWSGPGGGVIAEIDGGIPRDVRLVEATIPPGTCTGVHAHSGDEHHVVLRGRLRATQGAHTVELGPGDYLLWDATIPHDAESIGDEPAVVLIVSHRAHGPDTARPEAPH